MADLEAQENKLITARQIALKLGITHGQVVKKLKEKGAKIHKKKARVKIDIFIQTRDSKNYYDEKQAMELLNVKCI